MVSSSVASGVKIELISAAQALDEHGSMFSSSLKHSKAMFVSPKVKFEVVEGIVVVCIVDVTLVVVFAAVVEAVVVEAVVVKTIVVEAVVVVVVVVEAVVGSSSNIDIMTVTGALLQ